MALQQLLLIFRSFVPGMRFPLEHPEALGVADGLHEAVLELVPRVVLGQQQHVEAGVRGGQAVAVGPVAGDHQLQVAEPPHRHPVRARGELQQLSLVVQAQAVHDAPEVLDGLRLGRVPSVVLCRLF